MVELAFRPLLPPKKWDYFALDALPYHGHLLTIFYDRTGERYDRGAGLTVLCDGRVVGHDESLKPITVILVEKGRGEQTKAASERP